MVESSFTFMVQALQDPSVAVRDTIAWTLGRIAQFHPNIVPVKQLTPMLCEKLRDVPRVSANICWNLQVLAEAQPGAVGQGQFPDTTALSEFFTGIAQALLEVVSRPDADDRQLRMAGYNALSIVVSKAGNDCLGHMQALTQEMLNHLQASFKNVDRECELQGFICGVLTSLVTRLRQQVMPAAEMIMQEALKVIVAYQQVRGGAQVLQEEALLLVAALANAVGTQFERFMPHFAPHLKIGLENFEEIQVCFMTTGIVGDLCRALEGKIITYCDTILQILYGNLQNAAVDRKIKAAIMTCFGDIALAVSGEFEKYLAPVVQMLREASSTKLADGPAGNEDWIDYLNSLREGVLEAYTGIVHGLKDSGKLHLFKEHVNAVLLFVKDITEDSTASEAVVKAAIGVVGDLIMSFQAELAAHIQQAPFLGQLVIFAAKSTDQGLRQNAQWLQGMLQKFQGA
jgi:importin subunit beta-1